MDRYLYFVTENGKVYAPFENEIDEMFHSSSSETYWYITKNNVLCCKHTYPDEIDFDDDLGCANYSHWKTEYYYFGKVVAKFKTILELINYLNGRNNDGNK